MLVRYCLDCRIRSGTEVCGKCGRPAAEFDVGVKSVEQILREFNDYLVSKIETDGTTCLADAAAAFKLVWPESIVLDAPTFTALVKGYLRDFYTANGLDEDEAAEAIASDMTLFE